MASITERLPLALSERIAEASSAIYSRQGREVDVAIGGIPFNLATMTDGPQTIETIPVRKDQFDTENDPGEQSLSGWWRRSQSSWHEGAGTLYQEDSQRLVDSTSFFDSSGVDVFTPGKMTLLKKMVSWPGAPGGSSRARTYSVNSTRTNLCTNPSFETNTTGWVAGGETGEVPTFTRDTTKSYSGSASGRIDWANDNGTGVAPAMTAPVANLPPGAAYVATIRVFVPTGSSAVTLLGNGHFGVNSGATKDAWVTLTLNANADSSGVVQVIVLPQTPVAPGQQCWIDACLVEAGTIAGAYFDGSSPYSTWSGTAHASTSVETISNSGISVSVVAGGKLYTAPNVGASLTALHSPAATIIDGLISGPTFYDIATNGTLYQGSIASPGTATSWPCGGSPTRLGWGKHRLWVIGGRNLWQPDLTLASGSGQNPIFTHPNQGWNYTCMAEGASAMLFGGHDGFASTIQSVILDSGGGLPTLSGAAVTAALPDGELVQELAVLAGQYVGIGTNRGFRVGVVGTTGQITYGPLLIEPEGVIACTSVISQGRFFLASFRTDSGEAFAYRIDTGTDLGDGLFPYARDLTCSVTGAISSMVAVSGTQVVCTTADGSCWYQSALSYVDSGWLQTGRVRFRTSEFKSFKGLSVEIEPLAGAVQIDLIKEGGSTLPLGSTTQQGEVFTDSFAIGAERMRYASIRFTMLSSDTHRAAPIINSYQLRALPAVRPQRLITLPLMCFDRETTRSGQQYGGIGYASDRYTALSLLEDEAETVIFQDFTSTAAGGRVVAIESMRFIQTAPAPAYRANGAGGVLLVQLRTVDA